MLTSPDKGPKNGPIPETVKEEEKLIALLSPVVTRIRTEIVAKNGEDLTLEGFVCHRSEQGEATLFPVFSYEPPDQQTHWLVAAGKNFSQTIDSCWLDEEQDEGTYPLVVDWGEGKVIKYPTLNLYNQRFVGKIGFVEEFDLKIPLDQTEGDFKKIYIGRVEREKKERGLEDVLKDIVEGLEKSQK